MIDLSGTLQDLAGDFISIKAGVQHAHSLFFFIVALIVEGHLQFRRI